MSTFKNISEKSKNDYIHRINRVMDYIETHLHEPLTLEGLAAIACFSRYHFHRLFQCFTGERLAECIQRLRLEKAATLLKSNRELSITDIAFMCGFASSASFANGFKKHFRMSASYYRNDEQTAGEDGYISLPGEDLDSLDITVEHGKEKERYHVKGADYERYVDVRGLPGWRVAYIRYTGPYKGDGTLFTRLWKRLMRWAAPRGVLNNPGTHYFALYHDNPEITAEEKLRVSLCVSIDDTMETSGEVGSLTLPGGKYAICRFLLGEKEYSAAWGWVYGTWLPLSGYQPDDRPAFEWFPPHEKKYNDKIPVDICIPVRII